MSLTDHLEAHFRAHPGAWLSMQELARIAGTGGWRTRVSDLRLHRGMVIHNRTARIVTAAGQRITISEYRYVPPVVGQADLFQGAA